MKGFFITFLLIAVVPLKAQEVIWQKVYDKNEATAYSITETDDGCFVIGGEISYHDGHGLDAYLAKVDKDGKMIWGKRFGGDFDDGFYAISKTSDGGFILAGETTPSIEDLLGSVPGESDVYLVRTDKDGNKIWEKTFGGKEKDRAKAVIQTKDGNFIIVGYSYSSGMGRNDVYVIRTDKDGNKIWEKTFGGKNKDKANAVIQTKDGNFIIVGVTKSFGAGEEDIYLVKLNKHGKKIWSRTIGGKKEDKANAILETEDGGLIIAGLTRTFGKGEGDVYLIKTNKNGRKIWQKTFGGEDGDEAYSIIETEDGFISAGYTFSYGHSGDFYLIKVDNEGNKVWEKRTGKGGNDIAYSISRCSDGGFIVAGFAKLYSTRKVIYLVRFK